MAEPTRSSDQKSSSSVVKNGTGVSSNEKSGKQETKVNHDEVAHASQEAVFHPTSSPSPFPYNGNHVGSSMSGMPGELGVTGASQAYPGAWNPQHHAYTLNQHAMALASLARSPKGGKKSNNQSMSHLSLEPGHPLRVRIRQLIEIELRARNPAREDWQQKCHEMSKQLEEVILRTANSLEEYKDESTLSLRLVEIFMAKKKRDLAKEREGGDEMYSNVLEKAKSRWLGGEEIIVLLMKCSRKMPSMLVMNDPAFLPFSGSVFHFGSFILTDGYNWLKRLNTNVLEEHRFVLQVGGQPRVLVALHIDIAKKMHRRTYWLSDNTGVGVLVHYLSENPVDVPHSKACFCLSCLFKNESGSVNHVNVPAPDGLKRSRND